MKLHHLPFHSDYLKPQVIQLLVPSLWSKRVLPSAFPFPRRSGEAGSCPGSPGPQTVSPAHTDSQPPASAGQGLTGVHGSPRRGTCSPELLPAAGSAAGGPASPLPPLLPGRRCSPRRPPLPSHGQRRWPHRPGRVAATPKAEEETRCSPWGPRRRRPSAGRRHLRGGVARPGGWSKAGPARRQRPPRA